jgi:hypothetical protein
MVGIGLTIALFLVLDEKSLLYFWICLCYNKGNKEKRGEDGACQPYKGGNDDEEA